MFYLSKRAGLFEAPPEMVKKVWEWVLPRYAALVYKTTKDIKLKEAAGKDCNFNPEQYNDFETTIPLSLDGWKYDDEEFQTALQDWKNIWSDIKVFMFATPKPEYVGQYTDANNAVDVVLDTQWLNPSPQQYETLKASIYRNIEHEIIHLGQYIFKHFKNIDHAGMPSKSISDYTTEDKQKEHSIRNIEFYTILNDARIELQRHLKQWPKDMHDNIFKIYISSPHLKSVPRMFFDNLREKEPEKWQKAVKELYKTIEASMTISKRAKKEMKQYEVLIQPTESQLEYFLRQEGILYKPFDDRPNPLIMEDEYDTGVFNAFQLALEELQTLEVDLNFKIINDFLDYKISDKGQQIQPAKIIIETDDQYITEELKKSPTIRAVKPIESKPEDLDVNEVYQ